jgi:hypothetical protein
LSSVAREFPASSWAYLAPNNPNFTTKGTKERQKKFFFIPFVFFVYFVVQTFKRSIAAIIGRKLISFFLFELTDDNKIRQGDGLFTKRVLAAGGIKGQ